MAASKYPADVGRAALAALLARLGEPRHWRERAGPPGLLAGGLLIALVAGGVVALALAQLQGGLELADVAPRRPPVGAAPGTVIAAGVVTATPLATSIIAATPTILATPTPPREAPVAAAAVGVQSTAAPSPPTSVPAPTPTSAVPPPTPTSAARPSTEPTATPGVADRWQALLPELDVVWGVDMPQAIVLLDAFVARYPEHEPSRDKLYAALVEHARALVEQGAASDAVAELTRADELLPERVEASSALAALTPTATAPLEAQQPAPRPAPRAAPQTAPRPAPQTAPPRIPPPPSVASRPPAAPAPQPVVVPRRAAAPPPPPTPTKMPFVPPGGRQNREEGRDHDSH